MNKPLSFSRVAIVSCLCLLLGGVTSANAADAAAKGAAKAAPKAEVKAAPKAETKAAPKKAKSKKAEAPVAKGAETGDALNNRLQAFAQSTIASINRNIMPSAKKKQVTQNADGSYTCRYIAVDNSNVQTSYKKPESSTAITYVGKMTYEEVEYSCTAPSSAAAMAGPFTEARRESMTELVKYVDGKWTY